MKDMLPVLNGVHGGDWIACEMVSPGTDSRYPGMGGSCIASISAILHVVCLVGLRCSAQRDTDEGPITIHSNNLTVFLCFTLYYALLPYADYRTITPATLL